MKEGGPADGDGRGGLRFVPHLHWRETFVPRSMHLFLDSASSGATVTRRCRVERRDGHRAVSADVLWYSLASSAGLPDEADGEPYLLACVMQAMVEGRSLVVHGDVSRALLVNLSEFRDAWTCWGPHEYSSVDFECDAILDDVHPRSAAAAVAFTGGVDSAFSVWRHVNSRTPALAYRLQRPVLVHGFDIPLADEASFATARDAAQRSLSEVGLSLLAIRTNFQEIVRTNWEHQFAAAVVSAMQFCKGECGIALIGSSEPYDSLVFPWGSNPITDHLLSSATMKVVHDGAAFGRSAKIAAIADWQTGCENLRVCWQGEHHGGNCGRCEKCQRTMFNFLCNGLPVPASLPQEIDYGLLKDISLASPALLSEWQQILITATRRGLDERWMGIVRSKLRRHRLHALLDGLSLRRRPGD